MIKFILTIAFCFPLICLAQAKKKELQMRKEVIQVDSAQVEKIHKMPMDSGVKYPMPIAPLIRDSVPAQSKDSVMRKTSQ